MRLFSVFGHPEDGRALLQARERVIDYKEDWERQEQFVFTYSPTYAGFYHCSVNLYVWHTQKIMFNQLYIDCCKQTNCLFP